MVYFCKRIFHFPLTIFCTFANEQFKYEVNTYVRNPQKLQIENKNLKVFVGQVSDYDKIKETIAGCDAVIIALGISMKFGYDKASFATIVPGILASIFLPKAKKVLKQVHSIVVNSDLDWTIVRFMAPKNTPFTKEIKESFGDVKLNFNISREDIAYFMLEQVESNKYIHSMPIIGS